MIQRPKRFSNSINKEPNKVKSNKSNVQIEYVKRVTFESSLETSCTNSRNKSPPKHSEKKTSPTDENLSSSDNRSDEHNRKKSGYYNIYMNCFDSLSSAYKIISCIGKGSYGFVYKVKSRVDKNIYAIKVIAKKKGNHFTIFLNFFNTNLLNFITQN